MDLVWKKNPRGRLERKLNLAEREALLHVFSNGRKPTQADLRIANSVLEEMDRRKLWLKCNCVEHDPNIEGPFNCEVNVARLRHVKVIYTTNAIESLNSVLRHAIKKRKVFPTDESVKKVVWLAIQAASQKWTMPLRDWRMAMSRFIIEFGDRLDGHF